MALIIESGDSLNIDLSTLPELQNIARSPEVDRVITGALRQAAVHIRQVWGQAVQGLVLPGMTRAVHDDKFYAALHDPSAIQVVNGDHIIIDPAYSGEQRIETGYGSYDMKPALLNGPSARLTRTGNEIHRYNIIPMRHLTPGDVKTGRAHGAAMPEDIYKIVKKTGKFTDPGNAILGEQRGQRSKVPSAINLQAIRRGEPAPMFRGYTWRYGLYHNMQRVTKRYGSATQAQYLTFRVVSDNSDPSAFIHPGVPANPVRESVLRATEADVDQIIAEAIRRGLSGQS